MYTRVGMCKEFTGLKKLREIVGIDRKLLWNCKGITVIVKEFQGIIGELRKLTNYFCGIVSELGELQEL